MKRLLLLLPLLLAAPVSARVDPAVHKLCSDVKDYAGCVRLNKSANSSNAPPTVSRGYYENNCGKYSDDGFNKWGTGGKQGLCWSQTFAGLKFDPQTPSNNEKWRRDMTGKGGNSSPSTNSGGNSNTRNRRLLKAVADGLRQFGDDMQRDAQRQMDRRRNCTTNFIGNTAYTNCY